MTWTHEWPNESGWYWFYGDPHGNDVTFVRLYAVKVIKISNGYCHTCEGHFMFEQEASPGLWTVMIVPDAPTGDQP